jgi:hypothetical protein
MDWATATIEAVGLLILGIWIVIPIQEFKQIFAKIRHDERTRGGNDTRDGGAPAP